MYQHLMQQLSFGSGVDGEEASPHSIDAGSGECDIQADSESLAICIELQRLFHASMDAEVRRRNAVNDIDQVHRAISEVIGKHQSTLDAGVQAEASESTTKGKFDADVARSSDSRHDPGSRSRWR